MAPSTMKGQVAWLRAALLFVLWAVPLALTLGSGPAEISDSGYALFQVSESLAAGRGYPYPTAPGQPKVASMLVTAVLIAIARFGGPVPWWALWLSASAWSLTALVVYRLGRRLHSETAGALAALLVAFCPLIASSETLATHVPLAVCLVWWSVWATIEDRPRLQRILLCALLATRVGGVTLLVVALGLVWWRLRWDRWPWVAMLCVAVLLAGWGVLMRQGYAAFPTVHVDLREAGDRFLSLTGESEFYWFYAAAAAFGIVTAVGLTFRAAVVVWLGLLTMGQSGVSWALAATLTAFWAALGIVALGRWLVAHRALRLSPRSVVMAVAILGVLPLLVAQVTSQIHRRGPLPPEAQGLFSEAAKYVDARAGTSARLLASARVGYLAARPTIVYDGGVRDSSTLSRVLDLVSASPPAWIISFQGLGWDDLARTGWFQSRYFTVATFSSAYFAGSPVTVWQRRPTHFDIGAYESLNVRLPDGRFWVGYTYAPDRVVAGDVVSVTLYVHEPHPVEDVLDATVYLRSPGAGGRLAQVLAPSGRHVVLDKADLGRIIAETFALHMPEDLELGAYYLSASLFERDSDRLAQIYQDEQVFPIDRVTLGYVVKPWMGDLGDAERVGANVGDRAALVGYELGDSVVAGSPMSVTLYWEGRSGAPDASAQHFVFVHLLDEEGNLVAQHDGPPVAGRYPVQAWIPGEIVPDTHTLDLDVDLAPGTYHLRVGMYTWPTLERLPARDAAGVSLADGVIPLGAVSVR